VKWFLTILILTLVAFGTTAQKTIASLPSFPGGQKAFNKFLAKNLKWPNQDDAEGRVIISFVVEKDGRLTDFKVERSLRKEFDIEALRVLKRSPEWIPGMKNGKKVSVRYFVPINFTLSE
jgi:protein TonB